MSAFVVKLMVDAAVDHPEFEAITLKKMAALPFLPRIGDMLGVGADRDFMKVDEVMWSEAEGFVVWLDDVPEAYLTKAMQCQGWVEA